MRYAMAFRQPSKTHKRGSDAMIDAPLFIEQCNTLSVYCRLNTSKFFYFKEKTANVFEIKMVRTSSRMNCEQPYSIYETIQQTLKGILVHIRVLTVCYSEFTRLERTCRMYTLQARNVSGNPSCYTGCPNISP